MKNLWSSFTLSHVILLIDFFFNYWSIVDLYCCVSFWYMAQWLSYISVRAESLQLCPAFCNSMDCKLRGSSIHGFSRQEYWSELPCPLPGDFPDSGIEPVSLMSPALVGGFFTTGTICIYSSSFSFPSCLLQDIEYSSLYNSVGPCLLYI